MAVIAQRNAEHDKRLAGKESQAGIDSPFANIAMILIAAMGVFSLYIYLGVNPLARYTDFSAFYNAGAMAQAGEGAAAYDLTAFRRAYAINFPDAPNGFGWFYPPHFLALHAALASFAAPIAKTIWFAATFSLYAFAMRAFVKKRSDWVFVLCAPAVFINLNSMQTGYLTAGLIALYLAYGQKHSISARGLSGFAIGCLTIKPHLWLLVPVVMAAKRQWFAIMIAAMTTLIFVAISIVALGFEPWRAMVKYGIEGYGGIHNGDDVLVNKMSTLAALLTVLGLSSLKLYAQILGAVLAGAAVFMMARRGAPLALIAGFAITASFVLAPHNMLYDYMIMTVICIAVWPHARLAGHYVTVPVGLVYVWPYLAIFVPGAVDFPWGALLVTAMSVALFAAGMKTPSRRM